MDEKNNEVKGEYTEPSLLDIEDLEGVSGGGCYTGGTVVQKAETDTLE